MFLTACLLLCCIRAVPSSNSDDALALQSWSQYPEGLVSGDFGKSFSFFPFAYKRMLRWFPRLHVGSACFSYRPPDLISKILISYLCYLYFIFMYTHNNHCHRTTAHLQLNILLLLLLSSSSSLSPLCMIFIHMFLRQTISLGKTVFQLFCLYCLWCLYR